MGISHVKGRSRHFEKDGCQLRFLWKKGVLGHYFPLFVNFSQKNDKFSNEREGANPLYPPVDPPMSMFLCVIDCRHLMRVTQYLTMRVTQYVTMRVIQYLTMVFVPSSIICTQWQIRRNGSSFPGNLMPPFLLEKNVQNFCIYKQVIAWISSPLQNVLMYPW